jgi:hypothetical protein
MGRALQDGLAGIAPAERPSAHRGTPATQATTVMASDSATRRRASAPAAAVAPRQPRQGPPRRKQAVAQPAYGAGAGPRRRRSRLLPLMLGLFALALVIVAIVLVTAPSPTRVVLRNVVYSDVQQASSALKSLVSENTK